jgi:acetone carboxylase gamma subunit
MGLKIVRDAAKKHWWSCTDCDHVYCPADEDPKEKALIRVGRLSEFSHPTAEMTGREPPRFFQRQFYCPGCGTMFTNELARPDDPILREISYDPEWLARLD